MSEVSKKNFFGSILDKLKKIKHLDIILIVLFVAIILLIYFSSFAQTNDRVQAIEERTIVQQMTLQEYSKELTDRLEQLVSSIDGAGKVRAMVYFDEGIKTEIAYIVEVKILADGTRVETKSPVLISNKEGKSETVVLQEIMPSPVSVIVVASGAKDTNVKLEILRLVQTMFGLSSSKVEIFG